MSIYFFHFFFLEGELCTFEKCTINGQEFGVIDTNQVVKARVIREEWIYKGCLVHIPDSTTVLFLKWPCWSKGIILWKYTLPHSGAPLPSAKKIMKAEPVTCITEGASIGIGYQKISEYEN